MGVGSKRARLPRLGQFRVSKVQQARISSSAGQRQHSRYVRLFLARMEVPPTVSPPFLVPNEDIDLAISSPEHDTPEAQLEIHRKRVLKRLRWAEGHKPGESKLRHSFSHICPSEECFEALCDIEDDDLLEQVMPCASTGLSSAAFIEFIVTGLGSYALSTLKLIDTMDVSLQLLGLDTSLRSSLQTT